MIKFRFGELFSGPGGMSYGALTTKVINQKGIEYGMEHSWASDYDRDSCDTYIHNIPGADINSVFHQDVKDLKIEKLPPIDAFAYGFPCNDFSLVGEQKGFDGEFGSLYRYGVKVLNFFEPKFFVAENVGGLSSANSGLAFKKIIDDLGKSSSNGYDLTIHKYKSEEYGVPQTRHRIIIVGIRKDLELKFGVPKPTTLEKSEYSTVKEALESPRITEGSPNHVFTQQSKIVVERLKRIEPGKNIWETDLPPHLQLNVKGAKLSQIYKRLHPDKPSYTITGSGGGGTHGYHYSEPRALTNRERARIQTFPDSFIFEGSKESIRKQIGMAVPPKLSQVIFTSILKTFAGINYQIINPNIDPNDFI
jgi:DNA (cytosine-5)-methyltransferase 1